MATLLSSLFASNRRGVGAVSVVLGVAAAASLAAITTGRLSFAREPTTAAAAATAATTTTAAAVVAAAAAAAATATSTAATTGDAAAPELPAPAWLVELRRQSLQANPSILDVTKLAGDGTKRAEFPLTAAWRGRQFVRGQRASVFAIEQFMDNPERVAAGARVLQTAVHFGSEVEGPPGCVHGGAIAAVLDDCLGSVAFANDIRGCVTVNLTVNYKKFVPLQSVKLVVAEVEKTEGRKVWLRARLTDGADVVHAEGVGLFIHPRVSSDQSADEQRKQAAAAAS